MQSRTLLLALGGSLLADAAPTVTKTEVVVEERQLLGGLLGGVGDLLDGVLGPVLDTIDQVAAGNGGSDPSGTVSGALVSVTKAASPTNVQEASAVLADVFQASPTPTNIFGAIAQLGAQGLTLDNVGDLFDFVDGFLDGDNSMNNNNPRNPSPAAYPKAKSSDAPYSLSETELRRVIHIPDTFQYGRAGAPQPIILVPGTGDTGYTTFQGNLIPLLQGSDIADPVWLNIPDYQLMDAQTNSEYVAYAINYIYGISNRRKVAVAGWSQGNINAQWAFKFWPSARSRVTDHVAFSPDYHGTTIANLLVAPGVPLPPSVLQQQYNSHFIQALRRNGGDSAYVPTTTIYSALLDEVVQPQEGTGASAFLLDARNAGASNNEAQSVCAGQLAGSFYTHEGTLYNPLGFALLKDALANDGPGSPQRLDLGAVCNDFITPGLDLTEFLLTENTVVIAGAAILLYDKSVTAEPAIRGKSLLRYDSEVLNYNPFPQLMLGRPSRRELSPRTRPTRITSRNCSVYTL